MTNHDSLVPDLQVENTTQNEFTIDMPFHWPELAKEKNAADAQFCRLVYCALTDRNSQGITSNPCLMHELVSDIDTGV